MRLSQFHLRTEKETPADAEVVSHQLMLRAGMLRKLAAGLYTWSPLGLRVPVSYTHLDVYKRQELQIASRDTTRRKPYPSSNSIAITIASSRPMFAG